MPNPAVPNELKRLTGNPGKRPLTKIENVMPIQGGYTEPHQPLEWAGMQLWDRTFKAARTWIGHTDVEALMIVCKQLDRQVKIEALWAENPEDFHIMRQLIELDKAIMSGLGQLGFTVDSRTRLNLAEIKAESAFQKLMSERS